MKDIVPENIQHLAPYLPGKPIEEVERELGITGIVKLASNENPLGASKKGVEAATRAAAKVALYPDAGSHYLKQALAGKLGVAPGEIVIGSGSSELIENLVRAFCSGRDEDEVLTYAHSFVMYPIVCQAHGVKLVEAPVGPEFSYDVDALLAKVTPKTKLVFLANPNNPTGAYLAKAGMERLLRELPPRVILAVDEAYREYVTASDFPDLLTMRGARERLFVLRTFSKIYGLAGLRLGYGYGSSGICDYLERIRLPFNVTTVAQAAGIAALDDVEHVRHSQTTNAAGIPQVIAGVSALGLKGYPSQGNFVLVDLGAGRSGQAVFEKMLRHGVIIRAVAVYKLPSCVRVTVGAKADNDRFLSALPACLG